MADTKHELQIRAFVKDEMSATLRGLNAAIGDLSKAAAVVAKAMAGLSTATTAAGTAATAAEGGTAALTGALTAEAAAAASAAAATTSAAAASAALTTTFYVNAEGAAWQAGALSESAAASAAAATGMNAATVASTNLATTFYASADGIVSQSTALAVLNREMGLTVLRTTELQAAMARLRSGPLLLGQGGALSIPGQFGPNPFGGGGIADADFRVIEQTAEATDDLAAATGRSENAFRRAVVQAVALAGGYLAVSKAVSVVWRELREMSSVASRATEVESAFGFVFGDEAERARANLLGIADATGRFSIDVLDASVAFQLMLEPMVGVREEAARMTEIMVQLGIDMGSLRNISPEEAMGRLQSALAGNTEALRTVIGFVSEARIQEEAYRLGLAETGKELTDQAKLYARASVFLNALSTAVGDAERTQDQFANTMVRLRAELSEVRLEVGTRLNQAILEFIQSAGGVEVIGAKIRVALEVIQAGASTTLTVLGGAVASMDALTASVGSGADAATRAQQAFSTLDPIIRGVGIAANVTAQAFHGFVGLTLAGFLALSEAVEAFSNLPGIDIKIDQPVIDAALSKFDETAQRIDELQAAFVTLAGTRLQDVDAFAGPKESADEAATSFDKLRASLDELIASFLNRDETLVVSGVDEFAKEIERLESQITFSIDEQIARENLRADIYRQHTIPALKEQLDLTESEARLLEKLNETIREQTVEALNAAKAQAAIRAEIQDNEFALTITRGTVGDLASAFGDVVSSAQSFDEAFQDVTQNVIANIVRMLAEAALLRVAFSTLTGGGLLSAGAFNEFFGTTFSAKGNVFSGGEVVPFAKGGVFDRGGVDPMLFANGAGFGGPGAIIQSPIAFPLGIAGEKTKEAIVPLERMPNGKLGVGSSGGGGGNVTFAPQFTIVAQPGQSEEAIAAAVMHRLQTDPGFKAALARVGGVL